MARKTKKRNKAYAGSNAAKLQPTITKVEAVKRSATGQWWHDNKKRVRVVSITIGTILIIIWLLVALIQSFTS